MNSATLVNKQIEMDEKIVQRDQLRAKLQRLEIQHTNLNNQKAELNKKCGLLFKPALLHDYDRTVEHIELKTKRVKKLKKTVAELEARIEIFEMQTRGSDASILIQSKIQKRKSKE